MIQRAILKYSALICLLLCLVSCNEEYNLTYKNLCPEEIEALEHFFKEHTIGYRIDNKTILIKNNDFPEYLELMFSDSNYPQLEQTIVMQETEHLNQAISEEKEERVQDTKSEENNVIGSMTAQASEANGIGSMTAHTSEADYISGNCPD